VNLTRVCLRTISPECLESSGAGICYERLCEYFEGSGWKSRLDGGG
jgi:hypothetical protein